MIKNKPVRVPSSDAKKYKKAVEKICRQNGVLPFIGDVAVSISVYRPRRTGDLDGHFKALLDSLKGFAYNDDKQISWLHSERFEDKKNPRVEIQIWSRGLL